MRSLLVSAKDETLVDRDSTRLIELPIAFAFRANLSQEAAVRSTHDYAVSISIADKGLADRVERNADGKSELAFGSLIQKLGIGAEYLHTRPTGDPDLAIGAASKGITALQLPISFAS